MAERFVVVRSFSLDVQLYTTISFQQMRSWVFLFGLVFLFDSHTALFIAYTNLQRCKKLYPSFRYPFGTKNKKQKKKKCGYPKYLLSVSWERLLTWRHHIKREMEAAEPVIGIFLLVEETSK